MNKKYETLEVSWKQPYTILLVLNRPEHSNAFNTKMAIELSNFFEELVLLKEMCRAVVLTGAGDKAFSAGGDLKERLGMDLKSWQSQHIVFERMINLIIDCEVPIIGAINGAAFGGGCEMVAALDFSYASENATFAQTETKIGIIPGIGGTQNLSRAIGEQRAKELIFSAKPFSAKQALEWGLINEIFPSSTLLAETLKTASIITQNAPIAVKQAKSAIHNGLQMTVAKGMEFELKCYNKTIRTKDRVEGVLAFNEKRAPKFEGK
jgi:enoyl-CoA hydratase